MMKRTRALGVRLLAVGLILGLSGCANLVHKNEIQTAARTALTEAGLTAGAEAFDTGEGFADSYHLLVCVAVPLGSEYDKRARAQALVGALNAVRETVHGHEGRVTSVGIRLTSSDTGQRELNKWCRSDARLLGISAEVTDLISVAPDRDDWNTADFTVPYPKAELKEP